MGESSTMGQALDQSPSSSHGHDPEVCYCLKGPVRDCPICLEPLDKGRSLFTTECGHRFHFSCIQANYHNGNVLCPLCRGGLQEPPVVLNDRTMDPEWFFGSISREEAEKKLKEDGRPGCFLVRESASLPGLYSLSVLADRVLHCRIRTNDNGRYYLTVARSFRTVGDLIHYYRSHMLMNSGGEEVRLRRPVSSTDSPRSTNSRPPSRTRLVPHSAPVMFSQEDPGDTSGADWTGYNESQLSHALQLDGIDDATRAAIIQAVFDTRDSPPGSAERYERPVDLQAASRDAEARQRPSTPSRQAAAGDSPYDTIQLRSALTAGGGEPRPQPRPRPISLGGMQSTDTLHSVSGAIEPRPARRSSRTDAQTAPMLSAASHGHQRRHSDANLRGGVGGDANAQRRSTSPLKQKLTKPPIAEMRGPDRERAHAADAAPLSSSPLRPGVASPRPGQQPPPPPPPSIHHHAPPAYSQGAATMARPSATQQQALSPVPPPGAADQRKGQAGLSPPSISSRSALRFTASEPRAPAVQAAPSVKSLMNAPRSAPMGNGPISAALAGDNNRPVSMDFISSRTRPQDTSRSCQKELLTYDEFANMDSAQGGGGGGGGGGGHPEGADDDNELQTWDAYQKMTGAAPESAPFPPAPSSSHSSKGPRKRLLGLLGVSK